MKPKVKISKPEPDTDLVMLLAENEEYEETDFTNLLSANFNKKMGLEKRAKLFKIEWVDTVGLDIDLDEWRKRLNQKFNNKRY